MAFTKINAAGIGSTETVTLHSLEVINNATVGGVLTQEDVTNVDSVGLITARNGIVVGSGITLSKDGDGFFTGVVTATTFSGAFSGDGSALTGVANTDVIFTDKITLPDSAAGSINVGLSSDIQIYHSSGQSYIQNSTGNFRIDADALRLRSKTGGEAFISANVNGAVELYHDDSKKLETASGGVTVTGTQTATDFAYSSHPGVASFTGDNSTTTMTIASGHSLNSVLVVYNGVVLTPTTDYTISGTTLTFTFTPVTSSQVVVRYLIK